LAAGQDIRVDEGAVDAVSNLTLVSANKSRGGNAQWDADDYDVRDDAGRVVGRIMRHPQAPKDQPCFWTIVEGIPPSIHNRGYAGSREQVMAAFKARRVLLLNDLESQFGL
jgi:hypothetical protein